MLVGGQMNYKTEKGKFRGKLPIRDKCHYIFTLDQFVRKPAECGALFCAPTPKAGN
jgi:hypothetical protein